MGMIVFQDQVIMMDQDVNCFLESRTPDIGFSIVPDFIGFCSSD